MSDEKKPTIKLQFGWYGFSPDHRQWKPSNPTISCDYMVQIDVPLTPDLIANATVIATQQITNQDEDAPILTPLGMRYCIDQFEQAMSDAKSEQDETSEDTSSWDDSDEEFVPTGKAKSAKKAEDDEDWGDTSTEPTVKDEKWDESWDG